jgi:uncharacterized protein YecE (DUF72 family)
MMSGVRLVRIGCSGFSYRQWRGPFYPEGLPSRRWLEHYATRFDTVEINATFYRLPTRETVEHWVEQTPEGFRFSVKGSRYLTHVRRLRFTEGIARFWEPLEPLREAGRLGPVLWQLPASFRRDDEVLAAFLAALPPALHCIEFREESWFRPAVMRLLAEHGASLVIGDDARRPLPDARPAGRVAYLRLSYGRRGRRGNYSSAELARWRRRLAAWRRDRDVYAYLNNDWEAFAPRNALELASGLRSGA